MWLLILNNSYKLISIPLIIVNSFFSKISSFNLFELISQYSKFFKSLVLLKLTIFEIESHKYNLSNFENFFKKFISTSYNSLLIKYISLTFGKFIFSNISKFEIPLL